MVWLARVLEWDRAASTGRQVLDTFQPECLGPYRRRSYEDMGQHDGEQSCVSTVFSVHFVLSKPQNCLLSRKHCPLDLHWLGNHACRDGSIFSESLERWHLSSPVGGGATVAIFRGRDQMQ